MKHCLKAKSPPLFVIPQKYNKVEGLKKKVLWVWLEQVDLENTFSSIANTLPLSVLNLMLAGCSLYADNDQDPHRLFLYITRCYKSERKQHTRLYLRQFIPLLASTGLLFLS